MKYVIKKGKQYLCIKANMGTYYFSNSKKNMIAYDNHKDAKDIYNALWNKDKCIIKGVQL